MRQRSTKDARWKKEWRAQCRRQLQRSIEDRMLYGFVRTYKPVLDDAPYRIFSSMAEYRAWCEANLPKYLGYYRVSEKGGRQID